MPTKFEFTVTVAVPEAVKLVWLMYALRPVDGVKVRLMVPLETP